MLRLYTHTHRLRASRDSKQRRGFMNQAAADGCPSVTRPDNIRLYMGQAKALSTSSLVSTVHMTVRRPTANTKTGIISAFNRPDIKAMTRKITFSCFFA